MRSMPNRCEEIQTTEDVRDILAEAVRIMVRNGEYADALFESASGISIVKDKVEEKISTPASIFGMSLRMYRRGIWREAAVQGAKRSAVLEVARELSSFRGEAKQAVKLLELKPYKINEEYKVEKKASEIPLDEKLKLVRNLFRVGKGIDKRIVNIRVGYSDYVSEKIFVNSEGSDMRQVVPRCRLIVIPYAKEAGRVDYDFVTVGGVGGFEAADLDEGTVEDAAESSIELLDSKPPPSGQLPVVLDPSMAGVFAHESFGHGCEADQIVRNRSYLIRHLGKRLSNFDFTIYDDGTLNGGHGTHIFDDEGIPSQKTMIVEKGVLKSFLHDRTSASTLNTDPTGNARRESFLRKTYVRMTNTYIAPEKWTLEEMVEGIKFGVAAVKATSGMEDPLAGGMQLSSKKGYLIENGRLAQVLSSLTLTGSVLDFVAKIDAVGQEDQFEVEPGFCGKGHGDYVPVADGGVYIRSEAVVSGG